MKLPVKEHFLLREKMEMKTHIIWKIWIIFIIFTILIIFRNKVLFKLHYQVYIDSIIYVICIRVKIYIVVHNVCLQLSMHKVFRRIAIIDFFHVHLSPCFSSTNKHRTYSFTFSNLVPIYLILQNIFQKLYNI